MKLNGLYYLFLGVVCSIFALSIYMDFLSLPNVESTVNVAKPAVDNVAEDIQVFKLADLTQLSEVTERSLFTDTRTIKLEKPNKQRVNKKPKIPFELIVTGIVTSGDKKMAILSHRRTLESYTLFLGNDLPDAYADWSFENLSKDHVVVEKSKPNPDPDNNDSDIDQNNKETKSLGVMSDNVYYRIDGW